MKVLTGAMPIFHIVPRQVKNLAQRCRGLDCPLPG